MPTIESLPKLIIRVQTQFNKYIRMRDMGKGCISCNHGAVEQASHFYSAGQYSALRFNEDNVHGSCLQCNYYLHGNLIPYRRNLFKRIGEQRVLILDSIATRQRVHKWSRLELEHLLQTYRDKIKQHSNSL